MDNIRNNANEILSTVQQVYEYQEIFNPTAIFKDKIFVIGTDGEVVSVKRDYDQQDSSYFFETPEIRGVIVKKKHGDFCVKASVKYVDSNNRELTFAKIRVEKDRDGEFQVMGSFGGTWEQLDYEDQDLITANPNFDMPIALDFMKNSLSNIYNQLCESQTNNDLCDPVWVKQLKLHNK